MIEKLDLAVKPGEKNGVTPKLRERNKPGMMGNTVHVRRSGLNPAEDADEHLKNPWVTQRNGKKGGKKANLIFQAPHSKPSRNRNQMNFDRHVPDYFNYRNSTGTNNNRFSVLNEWPTPEQASAFGNPGVARRGPLISDNIACGRCLGRDHTPDQCWANTQTCFKCGNAGHLKRACRLAQH